MEKSSDEGREAGETAPLAEEDDSSLVGDLVGKDVDNAAAQEFRDFDDVLRRIGGWGRYVGMLLDCESGSSTFGIVSLLQVPDPPSAAVHALHALPCLRRLLPDPLPVRSRALVPTRPGTVQQAPGLDGGPDPGDHLAKGEGRGERSGQEEPLPQIRCGLFQGRNTRSKFLGFPWLSTNEKFSNNA